MDKKIIESMVKRCVEEIETKKFDHLEQRVADIEAREKAIEEHERLEIEMLQNILKSQKEIQMFAMHVLESYGHKAGVKG